MLYPNLLSPISVRGKILKNRLESSNSLPHFLQGPEGFPADSVITHYANRAKGGAAIVTCMGINNFSRGSGMPMSLDISHFPDYDIYDPTCQNYLAQLADAIHFHGSIACMGAFVPPHAGAPLMKEGGGLDFVKIANPLLEFPPTPESEARYNRQVQEIIASVTVEQMELLAKSYAEQCKILKFIGFDMTSVHMSYRGQLVSKFLSPLTNARTDEFGGSLENRARFPLMVLKAIREAVGDGFLIQVLVSGEEPVGGYGVEDAIAFLKLADPYVDMVQVRAPDADPNHPTGFELKETPFLEIAAKIKAGGVKMLVSSVGGWQNPETAEKAISEGKIDLVSMARAWICNSDYGTLLEDGRQDDITPCLRCNKCHGRSHNDPFVSVCAVNPLIGIEHRLDVLVSPPKERRIVAVVGGGPAGLYAARILADRGHSVTLYEASDSLGGMIKHSDFVDFKWPLAQFKSYLIRQVQKKGINLKLNTFATPELIKSEDCDAAIIALGASPVVPPIPGLENAPFVFAPNAMADPSGLGQKVVVIGGGEVGVEAGMVIAATGRDVTVLEMRSELASDATAIHYRSMFQAAWEAIPTFKGITNAKVAKAEQGYVTYADVAGAEISIQADSIVVAVGMRSKQAEALSFSDCADRVRFVGDCVAPASIQQALRAAYAAACSI